MNELRLAQVTDDINVLAKLSNSVYANIRRVVARNLNTPKQILERLSYDPVMNVSYMAVHNPNNDLIRNFDETLHPCVTCEKSEVSINCKHCEKINFM